MVKEDIIPSKDYADINELHLRPTRQFSIVTKAGIRLGQKHQASDIYGYVELEVGQVVGNVTILLMAINKQGTTLRVLTEREPDPSLPPPPEDESDLDSYYDNIFILQSNENPFNNKENAIFKDLFWDHAGIVKQKAGKRFSKPPTKSELLNRPDYAISSFVPIEQVVEQKDRTGNIFDMYQGSAKDPNRLVKRRFIMENLGDLQYSIRESRNERVFPGDVYNENWLRNRFLQTSSYLSEVFAFPNELTREMWLCSWIIKGGSCLLSGIPGSGKTVLVDLSTILFLNSYGYTDLTYVPPIMDDVKKIVPAVIYKDLSGIANPSVLTRPPTAEELDIPDTEWAVFPNIETTDKTVSGHDYKAMLVPPTAENAEEKNKSAKLYITRFAKTYNLPSRVSGLLMSGKKMKIGKYKGPRLTQNFSRKRTGENRATWEDERFDEHIPYIDNQYYSRSLIKQLGQGKKRAAVYSSDILYDIARYPDDMRKRVQWRKEYVNEKKYIELAYPKRPISVTYSVRGSKDKLTKTFKSIKELRSAIVNKDWPSDSPDCENNMKKRFATIELHKSHIHSMWQIGKWNVERTPPTVDNPMGIPTGNVDEVDNPIIQFRRWYAGARSGEMSPEVLKKMNESYGRLYELLKKLVRANPNEYSVHSARSFDDITDEMKKDMGLTTCSENKTPEDILYTTEISLVTTTDAMGRPIQKYDFKPSPLSFVTKPGKFLNEFARADKDFQDQLLSLLDRRIVEHRGEQFKSPQFVLFCDNNPHKLLTAQIDWALWDRIDVELFLKGASLGTKDMILSRKFGRKDVRRKDVKKVDMEDELLYRIGIAIDAIDNFKGSDLFVKEGLIPESEPQGIIPLRFRELSQIWSYVGEVTIPRDVLRYTYLLTATLNQSWYIMRNVINTPQDAEQINVEESNMMRQDFRPFGNQLQKDRQRIVDFSMLSFAEEYIDNSCEMSNNSQEDVDLQYPLGITRQCGIRFVLSLLKYAKALAWLRRGSQAEVTIAEINDVFPMAGSHRLNTIPMGDEHIPGVHEAVQEAYPNIQDYLRYAIVDKYFTKNHRQPYMAFYRDLETIVDNGHLDVDECGSVPIVDSLFLDPTDPNSCLQHPTLKDADGATEFKDRANAGRDVLISDIKNGVAFAKRNSPDYKKYYVRRLNQVMRIGSKNYYIKFIEAQKTRLAKDYTTEPHKIFEADGKELEARLDTFASVLKIEGDASPRKTNIAAYSDVDKIVLPVLRELVEYKNPMTNKKFFATDSATILGQLINKFDAINNVYNAYIYMSQQPDDEFVCGKCGTKATTDTCPRTGCVGGMKSIWAKNMTSELTTRFKGFLGHLGKVPSELDVADYGEKDKTTILKAILDFLGSVQIYGVVKFSETPYIDCASGELVIVYREDNNGQTNDMFIDWKANTLNEHMFWLRARYGADYIPAYPLSNHDEL